VARPRAAAVRGDRPHREPDSRSSSSARSIPWWRWPASPGSRSA
jgi:hypothetical protein